MNAPAPAPEPRWRVRVDATACIGSGSCVGIAPRHFRLDGTISTPVRELVASDDDVLAAAECCPAEAITVTDTVTGEPAAPAW